MRPAIHVLGIKVGSQHRHLSQPLKSHTPADTYCFITFRWIGDSTERITRLAFDAVPADVREKRARGGLKGGRGEGGEGDWFVCDVNFINDQAEPV